MTNTNEQKPDRATRQLHRQRRRSAALSFDPVQPPPITNRRTGEVRKFGPRRAYDGEWVIEMLGASGCTREDVAAAIFVLEPLLEHDVRIDKDLLELLAFFREPVPRKELRQAWAEHNRSQFRIVTTTDPNQRG